MSFSPADMAGQAAPAASVDEVMAEAMQALAQLDRLGQMPTGEHVAVYETVQRALSDTLTAVDEA